MDQMSHWLSCAQDSTEQWTNGKKKKEEDGGEEPVRRGHNVPHKIKDSIHKLETVVALGIFFPNTS